MANISVGDIVLYEPRNGGVFPTGEETRQAVVENIREEIIVRQCRDGFINRIGEDQVDCVATGGSD